MPDPEMMIAFLNRGGPAMWAIAGLSVVLLAVVAWKLFDLMRLGVWARAPARQAVNAFAQGVQPPRSGRGILAQVAQAAITLRLDPAQPEATAREETARLAKAGLTQARTGLRALELIATIAPLIGLLGTVLGMIEAFQALQDAGSRADPSALAGGIWQALLTTAAGMAVAIPASVALSWFDAVVEGLQTDLEDLATRIFTARPPGAGA